jgi:hypothetical protein
VAQNWVSEPVAVGQDRLSTFHFSPITFHVLDRGLGPVVVGAVTLWWGFPAAIGLLALLYLLDLIVLLLFITEKRGAELG